MVARARAAVEEEGVSAGSDARGLGKDGEGCRGACKESAVIAKSGLSSKHIAFFRSAVTRIGG